MTTNIPRGNIHIISHDIHHHGIQPPGCPGSIQYPQNLSNILNHLTISRICNRNHFRRDCLVKHVSKDLRFKCSTVRKNCNEKSTGRRGQPQLHLLLLNYRMRCELKISGRNTVHQASLLTFGGLKMVIIDPVSRSTSR